MSVTPQLRGTWTAKLGRLSKAAQRAQGDLLVAIYEATQAGISQADISHSVEGVSPSGVAAKRDKGRKIAEGRKRT